MTVLALLRTLDERGITLERVADRLACAPADRLTDELRAALREHKPLLLRILRHDPLPREQYAVAPDGALVAATRGDFTARWGEEAGALCWSYWTEWGPDLVEQRKLSLDEALQLRDWVTEGPSGPHASALAERMNELRKQQASE